MMILIFTVILIEAEMRPVKLHVHLKSQFDVNIQY